MYDSVIVLLAVSSLFLVINAKVFKLSTSIGLLILGIIMSLVLIGLKNYLPDFYNAIPHSLEELDFNKFLMRGILPFLLFSGAIHVDVSELKKQKTSVFMFAVFSTVISTILVGYLSFYAFGLLGIDLPILYCLLFGALISPTDPIAVLSIFKNYNIKRSLTMQIEGESLFNDGIGIVVFVTISGMIGADGTRIDMSDIIFLFLREAAGGLLFGYIVGKLAIYVLKQISHSKFAIHTTLVVAASSYALAFRLDVSGALAMVAAGLVIGNWLHTKAKSKIKRDTAMFWEVTDEVLNAMLFVLIGFSIIQLDSSVANFGAGAATILIVLFSRFISVSIPHWLITKEHKKQQLKDGVKVVTILTWSGLKGGLAFALALSLIDVPGGQFIIFITYVVATFSIIIQGLSIGKLVTYLNLK